MFSIFGKKFQFSPLAKVLKYIENGEEDSLYFFASASLSGKNAPSGKP